MITFEINPPSQDSRCSKFYLVSILLVEKIIRKLMPKSDLHYTFSLIEDYPEIPKLKIDHKKDHHITFDETIVSDVNEIIKSICSEKNPIHLDKKKLVGDVKEFISHSLTNENTNGSKISLSQALDLLTPFAIEENILQQSNFGVYSKLTILLTAIYDSEIHPQAVRDALTCLETELFSVLKT